MSSAPSKPARRLGLVIATGALGVTAPLLLHAVAAPKGITVPGWLDPLLLGLATLGLAVAATAGGAYVASTAATHARSRGLLAGLWLLIVGGVTYLVATHLYVSAQRTPLVQHLPQWQVVLYCVAVALVAELAAVGALVADAVRDEEEGALDRLRAELDEMGAAAEEAAEAARVREMELQSQLSTARQEIADLQLQVAGAGGRGGDGPTYQQMAIEALRNHGVWCTDEEIAEEMAAINGKEFKLQTLRGALSRAARTDVSPIVRRERYGKYIYAVALPDGTLPEEKA